MKSILSFSLTALLLAACSGEVAEPSSSDDSNQTDVQKNGTLTHGGKREDGGSVSSDAGGGGKDAEGVKCGGTVCGADEQCCSTGCGGICGAKNGACPAIYCADAGPSTPPDVDPTPPTKPPAHKCPPAAPYNGLCSAVVVYAKDPSTGLCCTYSPCTIPAGMKGAYYSEKECLASK